MSSNCFISSYISSLPKITEKELKRIKLDEGDHDRRNQVCVMEAAAWFAGEPHSSSPKCVQEQLSGILVELNDSLEYKERQLLKELIPVIINTKSIPEKRLSHYMYFNIMAHYVENFKQYKNKNVALLDCVEGYNDDIESYLGFLKEQGWSSLRSTKAVVEILKNAIADARKTKKK